MLCDDVRKALEQNPDGLPSSAEAGGALGEHLSSCASCRADVDAVERAMRALEGLRPLEPPAELGARVRFGTRQRGTLLPWVVSAATMAALVVVLGVRVWPEGEPSAERVSGTLSRLDRAQHEYLDVIGEMEGLVEHRSRQWPARLRQTFKENMAVINGAIASCKQAAVAGGVDQRAQRYLLAAYEEKALLLREALEWQPVARGE